MTGSGLIALVLLSANVPLPVLSGQRVVTRERHVFEREDQVTIAVPPGNRAWQVTVDVDGIDPTIVLDVEDRVVSRLLRFKLPAFVYGSGELVLSDGAAIKKRWPIAVSSIRDESQEIYSAFLLRKENKYSEAVEKLADVISSPSANIRAWAEAERGHIAYMAGDRQTAEAWWLRAAKSAEEAGMIGEAHSRLLGVTFLRHQRGKYLLAEEALAESQKYIGMVEDPVRETTNRYHQGLLRYYRGEYLAAARILREVTDDAWAMGSDRTYLDATHMYALAEVHLGAFREAIEAFNKIKEVTSATPVGVSYARINGAQLRLMVMNAGVIPEDYRSVRTDYLAALNFLLKQGTPQRLAHARVRLAELALREDDVGAAEEELRWLAQVPEEERVNIRWEEPIVRAEHALRWRRFNEAEERAQALMRAADESTDEPLGKLAETTCAAMVLLAEISEARGRTEEAIARYRTATEAIERLATRLEVPRGRGGYLYKGPRAVEALAKLHLEQQKVDEAFALLSYLQSGPLEDLESAARIDLHGALWREYQLSREQLATAKTTGCATARPSERKNCEDGLRDAETKSDAALRKFFNASGAEVPKRPAPAELIARIGAALEKDEALLAIFRLGEEWVVFQLDRRGLKYERSATTPKQPLAGVKRSAHVYLLLGDRTEAIQEQLYGTLAAQLSMSRLASIDTLFTAAPKPEGRALVVVDADGTLPDVRASGTAMAELLGGASHLVGAHATRAEVIPALANRSVFHFIGHASLDDDPWSTELSLAGGETLNVADLVATRPVVGLAVLEGCATGAPAVAGELGFPQVMISSGARAVLATVRDLKPGEATEFLKRFYAAGGADRPADAFRRAVSASLRAKDESWRAFRLWGRR